MFQKMPGHNNRRNVWGKYLSQTAFICYLPQKHQMSIGTTFPIHPPRRVKVLRKTGREAAGLQPICESKWRADEMHSFLKHSCFKCSHQPPKTAAAPKAFIVPGRQADSEGLLFHANNMVSTQQLK